MRFGARPEKAHLSPAENATIASAFFREETLHRARDHIREGDTLSRLNPLVTGRAGPSGFYPIDSNQCNFLQREMIKSCLCMEVVLAGPS